MERVYNFGAGPAMLPESVIQKTQAALVGYNGAGVGILEDSHRGKGFIDIAQRAEATLRQLLGIKDDYFVLFLNDGATRAFSVVPRNLLRGKRSADYIETGYWSQKAIAGARSILEVRIAGSTKDDKFTRIPQQDKLDLDPNAAYVHYTANETIGGLEFLYVPQTGGVPLVADMSSNFLSGPFDIGRFGLVYASAQKNFGASGMHVVVARKDLVGEVIKGTVDIDNYKLQGEAGSMINTPSTIGVYVAGLVFDWIKEQGGLEAIAGNNRIKAEKLYGFIDGSGFYANPIETGSRSRMNVPFTLNVQDLEQRAQLEKKFVQEARENGLANLEGHRSVGGMRASIYNAMPLEGVIALIQFMKEFERTNGRIRINMDLIIR